MAIGETARLIASLELDPRKFLGGANKALGSLGRLESGVGRMGRGAGQLASGLGRAGLVLGGVVAAGIGGAAKAAIDFEDAFAGVRKTVDEADLTAAGLSFDILARKFRDMATEIPIAATEFARIGEAAGALGVKAGDLATFTKTVALLGVTTNLSTDEASEALGKVGTILNLTGDDFTKFADTLVNLGNKGASTESEIIEVTKRFAAMGRQAGLTTEEILALSSAATSLGAEPEAAGSALSRIFSNMTTNIALADKKGQAFAKVTAGVFDEIEDLDRKTGSHVVGALDKAAEAEVKRLRGAINRGEALPALQKFLTELAKLDRLDAAAALKEAGITNVRDRNAILLMAQNIGVVNDQLETAKTSTGALGIEATKRFDTIASKIKLFKQNVIEAGITIGEGLTPAIGRATDKLITFLKDPVNKGQLKALGEDIGKAIDKIEWDKVLAGAKEFVGLLKGAGGVAIGILETLNKLPTEVKAAGIGLLGLNKISGGLVGAGLGNIIGGLAETITRSFGSMLPGVAGKLFVQPVLVTNWPAGGLGGVGGAGAAAAGGGLVGSLATAGAGLLLVDQLMALPGQIGGLSDGFQGLADKDLPAAAEGLRDFIDSIPLNPFGPNGAMFKDLLDDLVIPPLNVTPFVEKGDSGDRGVLNPKQQKTADEAKAAAEKIRERVNAAKDAIETGRIATVTALGNTQNKIAATRDAIESLRIATATGSAAAAEEIVGGLSLEDRDTRRSVDRAKDATEAMRISLNSKLGETRGAIVGAGHNDADRIVAAIKGNRPNIDVFVTTPGSGATKRATANYRSGQNIAHGGHKEFDP